MMDVRLNFQTSEVKIYLEQSFSDFGDADAVLLLKNGDIKRAIFIEAKVKTYQKGQWNINDEFRKFEEGITDKVSSSNFFTQLYHKVRLVNAIKKQGIKRLIGGASVNFPKCSTKMERKIGKNLVVHKAIKEISKYVEQEQVFYVGIFPDKNERIEEFFVDKLKNYNPQGFHEWSTKDWGYISWGAIKDFCDKNNLVGTLENFKHNEGQIY